MCVSGAGVAQCVERVGNGLGSPGLSITFINLQAPCVLFIGQAFRSLYRTLFMYLINKYISLFDICLTVHH